MNGACFVVGCGSIGRRHIQNLRMLKVDDIRVFDVNVELLKTVVRDFGVRSFGSFEDGLAQRPALTLVCTPPHRHVSLATSAIEAGSHVFIEKPISDSLSGVDGLLGASERMGRSIHVGYNWRFHPGLMRIHELLRGGAIGRLLTVRAEFGLYLPYWRPHLDYRTSYTAHANMGGGIIRDSSHEIDYVRWLAGEVCGVYCAAGKISSLEMNVEDTAEITLRLESGGIAQIHMDCTQRVYTRTCKLIGEGGTLVWDYAGGIRWYDPAKNTWREEPITYDANAMYIGEMTHVLASLSGKKPPAVDALAGKRVLEITLAALESVQTGREVHL